MPGGVRSKTWLGVSRVASDVFATLLARSLYLSLAQAWLLEATMNKTFDRDKSVLVIGTAVLVVPSGLADQVQEDAFVEALVALRQDAGWWLVELCHDSNGALMGIYKTKNIDLGNGVIRRTTADISLAKRHICEISAAYSAMLAGVKIGGTWKAAFKTPNV